jgi:hypothetical protein
MLLVRSNWDMGELTDRANYNPISGRHGPLVTRPCLDHRRGAVPGPFFFTLGLRDPRGSVRFGLGGRFFRAARLSFLRSALSLIFCVSMIESLRAPLKIRPCRPEPPQARGRTILPWKSIRLAAKFLTVKPFLGPHAAPPAF